MSSLREVAEAANQDPDINYDGDFTRGEDIQFAVTFDRATVLALLDVVDAARSLLNDHAHAPARNGQGDWDEWAHYAEVNIVALREALARLPEEVRDV